MIRARWQSSTPLEVAIRIGRPMATTFAKSFNFAGQSAGWHALLSESFAFVFTNFTNCTRW
jgi:hypothetical protein